jgi:hypothetical protein
MASIVQIDGTNYLDVKLAAGCRGTTGTTGCGLEGALTLSGVGDSATLEYTCAPTRSVCVSDRRKT